MYTRTGMPLLCGLLPRLLLPLLLLPGCGDGRDPFRLQDAAQLNAFEWVDDFLAAGDDPAARDDAGYTALHVAATGRMGQRLIEAGADVNARADDGMRPLHAAIVMARVGLARRLLRDGADANAVGPHGYRPLHYAAAGRDTRLVHALLRAGADPGARTADGQTALQLAAHFGNRAVAQMLEHWAKRPG